MLAAALVLLAAAEPPKLASTTFVCEGFSATLCEAHFDRFTARLSGAGVKVTTQKDIAQALGLDRQRQLLGCTDENGCLAELGAALGVDGILSGSVVDTGDGFLVTVKVVRARDGSKWKVASNRARSEAEVQEVLDRTADYFARELVPKVTSYRGVVSAVAAGLGLVAVTGGVLYGVSKLNASTLRSTTAISDVGVANLASQGSTLQAVGLTLLCIGLPLALAGGAWAAFGFRTSEPIALWLSPDGLGLAWSAAW